MLRVLPSFLAVSLLALAVPAEAASFDCSKAEAPDEVAVCGNAQLSELDTEMGALWFTYQRIPFLMGANAARKEDAEAFLQERKACGGDEACIRKAYEERISGLEAGIQNWLRSSDADPGAPPWSNATLPVPITSIITDYQKMCSDIGGTLAAGAETPLVMTADLDGDGVHDFVLNPQNMQCSAAATAFCANDGCRITLALSRDGYADPATIMGGAPSLSQGEEGTVLEVWVANSNCTTDAQKSSCLGRYAWQDGELAVTHEAAAFPD
jgi:uncharacterized protein